MSPLLGVWALEHCWVCAQVRVGCRRNDKLNVAGLKEMADTTPLIFPNSLIAQGSGRAWIQQ